MRIMWEKHLGVFLIEVTQGINTIKHCVIYHFILRVVHVNTTGFFTLSFYAPFNPFRSYWLHRSNTNTADRRTERLQDVGCEAQWSNNKAILKIFSQGWWLLLPVMYSNYSFIALYSSKPSRNPHLCINYASISLQPRSNQNKIKRCLTYERFQGPVQKYVRIYYI